MPVTLGVLLLGIIGVGIAGWQVAERGFAARDELQQAIPLATKAQEQVLAGDAAAAAATIDQLAVHAAEARRPLRHASEDARAPIAVARPQQHAVSLVAARGPYSGLGGARRGCGARRFAGR